MRKKQKKILGIVGLVFVAAITAFAASIPSDVFAIETQSFTETITVRVVGDTPDVVVTTFPDEEYTDTIMEIPYTFENVEDIEILITYTDKDGVVTGPIVAETSHPDYYPGDDVFTIDFETYLNHGYGDYEITIRGTGYNGALDEETVLFSYMPIISNTVIDEEGDDPETTLIYDADIVCSAVINVYRDGKLVTPPSPITIDPITADPITLLFEQSDLATGTYNITTTAYDCDPLDPQPLYDDYIEVISYTSPEDLKTPDTGFIFKNLNISRTDYLVTGLLLFFSFAIVSIAFVKKDRNKKRR